MAKSIKKPDNENKDTVDHVHNNAKEPVTQKIEGIKRLLLEADRNDVVARYRIAAECRQVIEGNGKGKVYGAGAAKKLGVALGWSKSQVHAYATVAETWEEAEFQELVARKTIRDNLLSWSHFVLLAGIKDAQQRQALTERTLSEGLSVRDLKIEGIPKRSKGDLGFASPEKSMIPDSLTAAAQKFVETIGSAVHIADTFGGQFDAILATVDLSKLDLALVDQLKQARENLVALHETHVSRLDAWISRIESGKQASPASTADAGEESEPSADFEEQASADQEPCPVAAECESLDEATVAIGTDDDLDAAQKIANRKAWLDEKRRDRKRVGLKRQLWQKTVQKRNVHKIPR